MPESAGTFGDEKVASCKCRKCGGGPVHEKCWESSCGGYENFKYTCQACGHSWWVEGIDS
jgi:hypothetical protein